MGSRSSSSAWRRTAIATCLKGDSPKLTLKDFVDDCAKFGLEGTELTSYYFPASTTPEYLRTLRRQCFRLGLDVSGTAVGNDFGHPPGESPHRADRQVKQWIEYAEILGAPVIRIFAGSQKKDQTEAQTHSLMVAGDRGMLRLRRQARRASGPGKPRRPDRHGRRPAASSSAT